MKLRKINYAIAAFLLFVLATSAGCGIYSFSGTTLSPEIKTISIQYFYDDAGTGPPTLSQTFTEKIKDYYQQNTNLTLIDAEGDLQLEGSIVGYTTSPVAPVSSGDANIPDEAGLTRLTITVKAKYVNVRDEEVNFDRNFSFYDDFNPRQETLTQAETRLIDNITERIIQDIFNASVANW